MFCFSDFVVFECAVSNYIFAIEKYDKTPGKYCLNNIGKFRAYFIKYGLEARETIIKEIELAEQSLNPPCKSIAVYKEILAQLTSDILPIPND